MNFLPELWIFLRACAMFLLALMLAGSILFVVPVSDHHSIVVLLFNRITHDLVPPGITLVAGSPITAFLTEVELSLFLAFALLSPLALIWLTRYLSPALTGNERRMLGSVVFPSVLLFLAGLAFGYFVVVPQTLAVLFEHVHILSLQSIFFLDDFINTVCVLLLVTGAIFLIPVFLPLATYAELVSADFWREHWRFFILGALLAVGILTKDGTGVTMLLLAIPLALAYGLGTLLAYFFSPVYT